MRSEAIALRPIGLLLFSVFVACYLRLFGPLDVYIHNHAEFSGNTRELIVLLSLAAAVSAALIFVLLYLSPRPVKDFLFRTLALLVLGAWIISNFFYGEYGRLDGTPLEIDPGARLALLQSVVLVALLFAVVKLSPDNLFKLIAAIFVIGLSASAYGLFSMDAGDEQPSAAKFPAGLTEFSPTRNVLHVVLDELGSETFRQALETDAKLKRSLDGFTLFSDTLSVYPSTEMSIVAMMTGEVYRNEEPKRAYIKKIRGKNLGVERLGELGYRLDSHTRCQLGVVKNCTMIDPGILNDDVEDIEALQLLDIFLFKAAPDYLKPHIYNEEKWLFLGTSSHNKYLKFQSGVAHLLFGLFNEELSVSADPAPRYKFFHSMVTHTPIDLGPDCEALDMEQSREVTQLEFIRCGLAHFTRLLERLEELGIYDETMIVLSSDHGDYNMYEAMRFQEFKDRGFRPGVVLRAAAALAIKPFDARGPVLTNPALVSLRDIPHTILAANDLEPSGDSSPGTRDAFSLGEDEIREREYQHYVWKHEYWAEEVLPPINTIKVKGPQQDPLSWPDQKAAKMEKAPAAELE